MMLCLGKESSKAEITSQEKRKRDFTDGFHEEVEEVKRDGFLVNLAKMTKKEQSLVVVKMLLKEQSKDADQPVPLVKLTKGGRGHELGNHIERIGLSESNTRP
jgi:hypothetical protein